MEIYRKQKDWFFLSLIVFSIVMIIFNLVYYFRFNNIMEDGLLACAVLLVSIFTSSLDQQYASLDSEKLSIVNIYYKNRTKTYPLSDIENISYMRMFFVYFIKIKVRNSANFKQHGMRLMSKDNFVEFQRGLQKRGVI